jgi:hypothetical protein
MVYYVEKSRGARVCARILCDLSQANPSRVMYSGHLTVTGKRLRSHGTNRGITAVISYRDIPLSRWYRGVM